MGEVPSHWVESRLDFNSSVKARLGWKGLTADEYVKEGYIFLATPNIKGQGEIDFEDVNYITAERFYESPEIMVQVGDVLIAKDGSTLGTTNLVRYLPGPATVNSSIAILRTRKYLDSSFFFRWLTSSYVQGVIQSMKDGQGVPHLFQADIKKFAVLLPPLSEQRRIADFLDTKVADIDKLIVKKQELIERLKEKRTALISHVVTKGLPPEEAAEHGLPVKPPLKPSGIPWLGEIPRHWEASPVKWCVATPVTDGPHLTPNFVSEGIPFVSAEGVFGGRINLESARGFISAEDDAEFSKKCKPKRGDVFVVKSGSTTGKVGYVDIDDDFNVWSPLALVRASTNDHGRFLFYALSSNYFFGQVKVSWSFGTQPNIGMDVLQNLHIVRPPREEQLAISAFLDYNTSQLSVIIVKAEEAILKFQEYRSALITAAVTGKIDVREPVSLGEQVE